MNYKVIRHTIGQIFRLMSALMFIPFITSAFYGELSDPYIVLAFVVTALLMLAIGFLFTQSPPKDRTVFVKEGMITVGISWLLISIIGALPLFIGNMGKPLYENLTFVDWLFESTSGFTTTGASILSGTQIESMSRGCLMWRSLTHWIGGMGVLLFVLALLPSTAGAAGMQFVQAESSGYSVGKLVSKTTLSAKILYVIYGSLTLLEVAALALTNLAPGGADVFNAFILAFGTAGTGGFAATAGSVGDFNVAVQAIVGVFMFLFGINFGLYFLLLTGRIKDALKNHELHFYVGCTVVIIFAISFCLWLSSSPFENFWTALPYAAFTTVSLMTTSGFDITAKAGVDFTLWPAFAVVLLLIAMFVGGSAGSTGGGFKCSRILVLAKAAASRCKSIINPHAVYAVKMDGKPLDDKTVSGVLAYLLLYIGILIAVTILLCLDPIVADSGQPLLTAFSASLSGISNIGPGLTQVIGPAGSFGGFAAASKILMSVTMLLGRLEIFPMLLLLMPRTYSRKS